MRQFWISSTSYSIRKKPNLSHYAGNMKNSLGGIEQVVDEDEDEET